VLCSCRSFLDHFVCRSGRCTILLVLTSSSCIVIPGWGGHPIGSFMAEDSPYLWILDGLGCDFPQLRVWTYGYGASLIQQGPGEDVYEFADSFVRSLHRLRLGLEVTCIRPSEAYLADNYTRPSINSVQ
jgi:hypothetical protein